MENDAKLIKQKQLKKIILEINNSDISSIKSSMLKILQIINDPYSTAEQLCRVIEVDPPLSGKVLKLANSAAYGARYRIDKIHQVIVWIGFARIKELAFSQKICEVFDQRDTVLGFSRHLLWVHSVTVALLNKKIYHIVYKEHGDTAYSAGLLHDIGIISEDQVLHDKFIKTLEDIQEKNMNMSDSEINNIGVNHTEIGMALAWDWGLPVELVQAIGYHHSPFKADEEYQKLVLTTYVSDFLAQQNEIGFCGEGSLDEKIYLKCLEILKINPTILDELLEEVNVELKEMNDNGWFG